MLVTLILDMEGVASLRDKWQPLLDQSRPNHVFMTWEWLFTWWKHFGRGRELFVLVVEDKGEVIGILPLMLFIDYRGAYKRIRSLHFIGHRTSDWMDVIGIRKAEVIRAALEYLRGCQHLWDYIDLLDLPEDSDTIAIISEIAHQTGFSFQKETTSTCPYVPTTADWERYYQTYVPKQVRVKMNRVINRFRAIGELKVEWSDASNLMKHLNGFFALHQRRQEARNQASIFSQEAVRKFHCDLAQTLPLDYLNCPVLKLDQKVIAAHFGFRYDRRIYGYLSTLDPDFSALQPGKVLLRYMVEDCFNDDNLLEYDFLFGNEPYKYEWAPGERHGCRVFVGNAYMSGWIGEVFRRTPSYVRRPLTKALSAIAYPPRPNRPRQ
ncbi:MAG: GNAT family N-acetyltransferase [Candidatus Acidiferrales bacterium]